MGETDDEGRPVKVWRKADRKDFKRFLFCVVGKRKMCDLTKRTKPLCPEVLCGFEMANGIQLATRSGFKNVVGEKPGDGYVRVYCERKGITPPWEVEPEMWAISNTQKAILDRAQNGINLGAGYTTNSSTAINSPPRNPTVGGLELKSLTQKIDTMEKKIEGLQSNNSGSSLDLILKKMEERMASMETKMEQRLDSMDTKMAKVDELATTVVNVTLLVQRLMQQAGMNVAGTNTASA
ncbi:hypothetical protein BGZ60DRAFT_419071 [Tricladium varicosporioides]|nr:hypothetical protein BGZ60DRAFT_419071 [Hymenoscyphus varicosporioides]